MNAVIRMSARNAWANRGRSAMTVLAVVLSVAFMSAVLMLSGGLSSQSDSGVGAAYQHVSVVVHGQRVNFNPPGEFLPESGAPVPAAALAAVRAVPGVTRAEGMQSGYAVLERADGHLVGHPGTGGGIGVGWLGDSPVNPYRLLAGHAPAKAWQVALDRAAATSSAVSLGQHLTLVTATGRHPVTVVGIVGYGSADGPFDTTAVVLPAAQAPSLLGITGSYDQLLVTARPDALHAIDRAVAPWNGQAQSGSAWVAAQRSAISTTLSFGRFLLYGFALVALLAGGILIFNTFTVSVAQRARELALARALGATGQQVRAAVLAETAVVGLIASLAGTVLGIGTAAVIRAVFSLLSLTLFDTQAVVTPATLLIPVLVGLAVTVLAALFPVVRAGRLAPMAALREPQIDESARSRARAVSGTALLVLGVVGTILGVSGKSNMLALAGVTGLVAGAVTAGPLLVAGIGRAVATPLRRIAGPPGVLSGRALARNPRRSAATASVLMIGVMLMSLVASLVASVNLSTGSTAAAGIRANFVIATASPWQWQVSNDVIHRVSAAPGVTATAAVYAAPALDGATSVVVGSVNPGDIAKTWSFGWSAGSLGSVTGDGVAVEDTALHGRHMGDTFPLRLADGTVHAVRITAVYRHGFIGFNAPIYLLPAALFHLHEAQPGAELLLVDGTRSTAKAISEALGGDQSVKVLTAADWVGQGNIKIHQLGNLLSALDVLAMLIAFAGITNTMALAVRERSRELGILRAVGALPRQLGRMINAEAAVLAGYAAAAGTALGAVTCWAITKSSTSTDLSQFSLPGSRLALIAGIAVVVAIVLTAVPARIARRSPVLQAIVSE